MAGQPVTGSARRFARIVGYTFDAFGKRQSDIYRSVLRNAFKALSAGPNIPESVARDTIRPGLRTLHAARQGNRARHFILYRAGKGNTIEIVRILRDAMDMARHLPPDLK